MRLKYKINYEYDYETNAVIIVLESPYFQEEYSCTNINNLPSTLGHALIKFNELHAYKIEELETKTSILEAIKTTKGLTDEDLENIYKATQEKKSNSKKSEGK